MNRSAFFFLFITPILSHATHHSYPSTPDRTLTQAFFDAKEKNDKDMMLFWQKEMDLRLKRALVLNNSIACAYACDALRQTMEYHIHSEETLDCSIKKIIPRMKSPGFK